MARDRLARLLTVGELARQRGRHPSSIRRWLLDLDAKHGGGVAQRIGKGRNARLYTTAVALARVAPDLVEPGGDLSDQVAGLQKDMDMLVDRTTRLLARVRELTQRMTVMEEGSRDAQRMKRDEASPRVRASQ